MSTFEPQNRTYRGLPILLLDVPSPAKSHFPNTDGHRLACYESPHTLTLALLLSCIKMAMMRIFTTLCEQSGPLWEARAFKAAAGMPLPCGTDVASQERRQSSSWRPRNSNRQIPRLEAYISHCKQRREAYSNRQNPRFFSAPFGGSFRGSN